MWIQCTNHVPEVTPAHVARAVVTGVRFREIGVGANNSNRARGGGVEGETSVDVLEERAGLRGAVLGKRDGIVTADVGRGDLLERSGGIEVPQAHAHAEEFLHTLVDVGLDDVLFVERRLGVLADEAAAVDVGA